MTPNPRDFPRQSAIERIDLTHNPGDGRHWSWHTKRFAGRRYANRHEQLLAKGVAYEAEELLRIIAWTYGE